MTAVLVLPVLLVGVVQWLMPSLVAPTLPFGVRVPRGHAEAPVVVAQRRFYRIVVGVAAVAAVAAAGSRPALVPVAVGGELVVGLGCYLLVRRRITVVKAAGKWFAGRRQVTVTDTALRSDPEPYPWLWALPAVLFLVATAVIGVARYPDLPARLAVHFDAHGHADRYAPRSFGAAFGPVVAQLLITVVVLGSAWIALRGSARLDAEDARPAERHRRFVAVVARGLLVLAALLNVTFLLTALTIWGVLTLPGARTALLTVPAMAGTVVLVAVLARIGQGGSRLHLDGPAGGTGTVNRDDDRLYRWGIVYYNREDPSVFVPKRFGIGWTVNMARPATWVLLAAIVVLVAAGPLFAR